ncbi:MAG: hypothetical protein M1815_005045 [Lichina confinis]|nr:MAG: hypothetical protein M1815_005045 [Lichina confinis]
MPIKLAPAPKNSGAKAAQDSQDDKSLSGTLSLQSRKEVASLVGMTFQQAQEAVISEMMTLEDTEGQLIVEPFLNLPPRRLTDYYALIKKPVSLRGVQKLVCGKHGRQDATGVSDFKSWDALEEEFSYIWRNAWEYNEDGSDISLLAGQLRHHFSRRMSEAREAAPEPTQPNNEASNTQRLKLKMPAARAPSDAPGQKIMLRVGGAASRQSTGPRAASSVERAVAPAATPEAEGGRFSTTPGAMPSESVAPGPMMTTPGTSSSSSVDRMDIGDGSPVPQDPGQQIPVQAVSRATADAPGAMLPPPSVVPGTMTTSPVLEPPPTGLAPSPSCGAAAATSSIQSRERPEGKGADNAFLISVTVSTHEGLCLVQDFRLEMYPSEYSWETMRVISFAPSHNVIVIVPHIAEHVVHRSHTLFFMVNGQEMLPIPNRDVRNPRYEVQLVAGVTRVDLQMVVGAPFDASPIPPYMAEREHVTLLANLLRH